jgi:hypothetical protein
MKYGLILLIAASCFGAAYAQFNTGQQQNKAVVQKEISVYPNPAVDYFTLTVKDETISRITVNNIIGKEVLSYSKTDMNKYDVSLLKKGIYVVRVFNHNDKLVKALRLSKS